MEYYYTIFTAYKLVYYYLKEIEMHNIFRYTIKILHKMCSLTISTQNKIEFSVNLLLPQNDRKRVAEMESTNGVNRN